MFEFLGAEIWLSYSTCEKIRAKVGDRICNILGVLVLAAQMIFLFKGRGIENLTLLVTVFGYNVLVLGKLDIYWKLNIDI